MLSSVEGTPIKDKGKYSMYYVNVTNDGVANK